MATKDVRVAWESLKKFSQEVFVQVGFTPEGAELQADVLVWANLRGVDSHGVLRIPWYVDLVDKGHMKPRPNIRVEKETPATLLLDADYSPGPVVTVPAMKRVIQKAREVGIGWAVIRNTLHQGAMGYYPLMAAKEGMAGIAIVCNPPNMAPHGARAVGVHNSPIAICVPGKRRRPLMLDMATSVAARGKLDLAVDKGIPIPLGWALDKDGKPTTDPNVSAVLLPAGGAKGSGLAMMFECLTSLFVGNPLLTPVFQGKPNAQVHRQNSLVAAIDIAAFTDLDHYKANADAIVDGVKALPTAEGIDEVLVPGEVEDRVYEARAKSGIPLPEGTIRNLRKVAERFAVKLPAGL
ncbi:MAG TPA: Ldh family oxidoreductase [Candidatus Methylomirabilis sp.]|nr:Ldh family oxidoreductase [Candidatus Methylomirabilis sp.]